MIYSLRKSVILSLLMIIFGLFLASPSQALATCYTLTDAGCNSGPYPDKFFDLDNSGNAAYYTTSGQSAGIWLGLANTNNGPFGEQIILNQTLRIKAYSVCADVKLLSNNNVVFVPLGTADEWNSFLNNHSGDVSVTTFTCPSPPTSGTCVWAWQQGVQPGGSVVCGYSGNIPPGANIYYYVSTCNGSYACEWTCAQGYHWYDTKQYGGGHEVENACAANSCAGTPPYRRAVLPGGGLGRPITAGYEICSITNPSLPDVDGTVDTYVDTCNPWWGWPSPCTYTCSSGYSLWNGYCEPNGCAFNAGSNPIINYPPSGAPCPNMQPPTDTIRSWWHEWDDICPPYVTHDCSYYCPNHDWNGSTCGGGNY